MIHDMICVGCPMGCQLTVTETEGALTVAGNQCKIGETYGKTEATNPTRNITTSVRVINGDSPLVSVKTKSPVPKGMITEIIKAIKQAPAVTAPVASGDVIIRDVLGTGADIVATRTVKTGGGVPWK
jgi:CxxC motif-containing protein